MKSAKSLNRSTLARTSIAFSIGLFGIIPALGFGSSTLNTESAVTQMESVVGAAKVGELAPDFTLTDLDGNEHSLSSYIEQGKTVVLEWFNPTCPFVKKHYREDTMTMVNMQESLDDQPVVWLRINSAREGHNTTGVKMNSQAAEKWGITSPILLDSKGTVGKSYGAKRTPDMFIIDSKGVLVYMGAIDNDDRAKKPGDVNYVSNALDEILDGKSVSQSQTKRYGCSIKY